MSRLLGLILISTTIVTTAGAQERTFRHEFPDRTVYVEVAEHWLEVWSVTDQGCMMYPSAPSTTDTALQFSGGTMWHLEPVEDGLEITFPEGRTVTYRVTDKEPERICGISHDTI